MAGQLQALLQEKARLASENARLAHENISLQVSEAALVVTCLEMPFSSDTHHGSYLCSGSPQQLYFEGPERLWQPDLCPLLRSCWSTQLGQWTVRPQTDRRMSAAVLVVRATGAMTWAASIWRQHWHTHPPWTCTVMAQIREFL